MNYLEPQLYGDTSIIDNKFIRDSDIFKHVGYKNYIMLHRKYPYYFKKFEECSNITEGIGYIPGEINLLISDDPERIKKDIVKTMYYGVWFSENSDLVFFSKDKLICKPTDFESDVNIWIFICIIMISLIIFAIYIMTKSTHLNKIINFKEK